MTAAPMLAGTTVLDLTHHLAGPTATRLLAELGADVVQQNRGTRSLWVDWVSPQGLTPVRDLAAPLLGEHDDEVLRDHLGLTDDETPPSPSATSSDAAPPDHHRTEEDP